MAKKGLYANINKRKKAGTSRSKKKSTISKKAKSEKQKKYLFANEPEIAKRWTKNYKQGGFVIVKPRGFGRMLPNKRPRTRIYT